MNLWKSLLFGSALTMLAPLSLAAHGGGDSSLGTWKLDVAKSAFGSQSPPKAETRIYSKTREGTHVVIEDTMADGKVTRIESNLTYDGKAQPLGGSPDFDSAISKRISRNLTTADLLRAGKVVGKLRRVVSQDGKSMTINIRVTRADGTAETALEVYERQ